MKRLIHKLLRDERGVTSIEYAFIASLIAIVIVVAVIAVGEAVKADFDKVEACLSAPSAKTCTS
jgi:pilus assembly protein Flp/PilA